MVVCTMQNEPIFISEPFNPDERLRPQADAVVKELSKQFDAKNQHFIEFMVANIPRYCADFDLIQRHQSQPSSILDIGALPPVLIKMLSQAEHTTAGLDVDPERMANAEHLNIRRCDIEIDKIPFPDNSFDAVILFEVFEHLRIDIAYTLSEIKRVLRKGGNLYLSTPNLRSLDGIYHFLIKDESYSCSQGLHEAYESVRSVGHAGHIREYTMTEVLKFLSAAGFEPKIVIYRGRYSTNTKQLIARIFPFFRPFFVVIAQKHS